ncbi:tRNA (adenosine(37)-N6)-dimethylallyltransferase MiaA [Blattabacterium cuenoti]|uniref:tRNA (adenosine(37)-N6)-dimethylallyltransferase MiaA n=1 Tax=Blattabacterium cuenoti TaxID=1653831 RepID=UPI001EE9DA54|nr:tRNA (adenosine(37)-N6)-dimethylallyltransferase MiaA [Blattabacterium cuenoti]
MNNKLLISIVGPTCVGKTYLSLFLAKNLKTEILSNDSRQFYKELKIGTSKPTVKELKLITHHFIGNKSIYQDYNAKLFEIDFLNKIKILFKKYNILIMVGGSGLYEKAALEGLSEIPKINLNIRNELIFNFKKNGIQFLQKELKTLYCFNKNNIKNIDLNNPRRLIRYIEIVKSTGKSPSFFFKKKNKKRNFNIIQIGLFLKKEIIHLNINNRVDNMIKNGLLNEVKEFYSNKNLKSLQTIGYKEIFNFLDKKNKSKFDKIIDLIKYNTKKYAKRQLTWYKKNKKIIWYDPCQKYKILNFIEKKWVILDSNQ